jgi:putative transposase
VFVTLRGEPYQLWRAVDQHGAKLDILLQKRRSGRSEALFRARCLSHRGGDPWSARQSRTNAT